MSISTIERVGVSGDDGDGYARLGAEEAELHANGGTAWEGDSQPALLEGVRGYDMRDVGRTVIGDGRTGAFRSDLHTHRVEVRRSMQRPILRPLGGNAIRFV